MGGLKIEDIHELPEGYQKQVVEQILEKVSAAAPGIRKEVRRLGLCPSCCRAAVIRNEDPEFNFCTECGWTDAGRKEGMELESCPFCRSESLFCDVDSEGWYLECNGCGARGPNAKSPKDAEAAWNRRRGG